MNSMTGYGKGVAERDGLRITVEMKSVNHRFLDVAYKLPKGFQSEEDNLKKSLVGKIKRGHLDIFLSYEKTADKSIALDKQLAKTYIDMAKELETMGVVNDVTAASLLRMQDVITSVTAEDEGLKSELVREAAQAAVGNLVAMRKTEGDALCLDLKLKIGVLEGLKDKAAELAPTVRENYHANMLKRVKDLLSGVPVDEVRILNEVAVYADRVAVDEELVRLGGHLKHFLEIIDTDGSGKSLDFLVQELGREVNTLGSKSNDLRITELVLLMKNEVEKLREQLQNLE